MARVRTIAQAVRDLAGGRDQFDIPAASVRELIDRLEERHAGLGTLVREQLALAIDGELHHDAWHEPLAADAEVVLVPRLTAG
jgi:molybdopterin converting factor small subunit